MTTGEEQAILPEARSRPAVDRSWEAIALDDTVTIEQYLHRVGDLCVELLTQHTLRRIQEFRNEAARTRAILEQHTSPPFP